jgi:hypothetical protein
MLNEKRFYNKRYNNNTTVWLVAVALVYLVIANLEY